MSTERVILTLVLLTAGKATHYAPGVMEQVVENRGMAEGQVALADCSHLGRSVYLESGGEWHGPYVVADCGQAKHQEHLKKIGFAVDLSYPLAEKLGTVGRTSKVKVWLVQEGIQHGKFIWQ